MLSDRTGQNRDTDGHDQTTEQNYLTSSFIIRRDAVQEYINHSTQIVSEQVGETRCFDCQHFLSEIAPLGYSD